MKSVAIVGLGWLGMPLAMRLKACGLRVNGSKTTADGVRAVNMCGIDGYLLMLTPNACVDADDLKTLLQVQALVITLPPGRLAEGSQYVQAVQTLVDSALVYGVSRILFTSSVSVYGGSGVKNEQTAPAPATAMGRTLLALEQWLHNLPGVEVDILRLAGLVGPGRHPGAFLAGKRRLKGGARPVNLLHLEDAISAIETVLRLPEGGRLYNVCAPAHPLRAPFYVQMASRAGLAVPQFIHEEQENSGKIIDGSRLCRETTFRYRQPDPQTMLFD